MAHHFESVSLASIPANLAALPAVAPVMWLGMLVGAVAQLPGVPVEPLTWLAGLFAAYIAQVAHWFATPNWSLATVELVGPLQVAAAYLLLAGGLWLLLAWLRRRRGLGVSRPSGRRHRLPRRVPIAAALGALTLLGALAVSGNPSGVAPGLRLAVLDVGQGDSILLDPSPGGPILVDAGPPGTDLADSLAGLGVDSLAAVLITHDQADHAGGLPDLVDEIDVDTLLYGHAGRRLLADVREAGIRPRRVAESSTIRSGELRLEILWPPRTGLEGAAGADPNADSVVALASWHRFDALLTGDAEAELAPVDPGPLDVLKIAHHGSEDAGLDRLLEDSGPRLALISVGEDNPYGHPAPPTLATLAEHGVSVLRTDESGTIVLDVGNSGWTVDTESGGPLR
jgi:competence protein ComEC